MPKEVGTNAKTLPPSGKSYIISFHLGGPSNNITRPVHCNVKAYFGDDVWMQYVADDALTPFKCDHNDNFIIETSAIAKWVEWGEIEKE